MPGGSGSKPESREDLIERMNARVYLDHNATSPLRQGAAKAVSVALSTTGNPSSVHAEGRASRALIEKARDDIAALAGTAARRVAFTGSATEALNLALSPSVQLPGDERDWMLLLSPVEHVAALRGHRFPSDRVEMLSVDRAGVLDLGALDEALDRTARYRPLLALQLANNETGVIQPVAAASGRVRARGGAVICDAVQAARFMQVSLDHLGADAVVLSGHKLGGLAGSGALVRRGAMHFPDPAVRGGGQESGLSAGTHNIAGIAAFGAAAAETLSDREAEAMRLGDLRRRLEAGLRAIDPDVIIFGEEAPRLPNTTAFAIPGVPAETMLMRLDLAGYAVSSGSACSSGRVERSHVLDAMGVGHDLSSGMLRISTGWTTSAAEIDRLLEAWSGLRRKFSAAQGFVAA